MAFCVELNRSVVAMTDLSGEVVNRYEYDPFGNIFGIEEQISNPYQYIGQWGVQRVSNFHTIHYMRARFYDSQLGRFLTVDPLGLGGKSENVYCYVNNNPIEMIDPKGTNPVVFAALGAFYGATNSLIVYITTADEVTLEGAVIAAGKGVISGAVSVASKGLKALTGGALGVVEELYKQAMSGEDIDWGEVAFQGVSEALLALLPSAHDILGKYPSKCNLQIYLTLL